MSSNITGTGADPQPKKGFSVRSIRGNWRQSIERLKKSLADLRAGMRSSLLPARPDRSTREEVPIQHDNKPDSNKPGANKPGANKPGANKPGANKPGANKPGANKPGANKPGANKPGANKPDANKPDVNKPDANKPEDTKRPEEDNEPHEAPVASFTEQTPKKEDESTASKHPNRHPSQVRSGSRTTTAGKKYYKYLRVPPNSPDRGSVETTLTYEERVDVIRDTSFKRPFIGQKTPASWKDSYGGLLLDPKNFKLIMMHRMRHEFGMRRYRCRAIRPKNCDRATTLTEYFDLQMHLRGRRNAPRRGCRGSETEEGSS